MLDVLDPSQSLVWLLVTHFLPQFNPDLLQLVQIRPPPENGIWRGLTISRLYYGSQLVWEKATEHILDGKGCGSIHDSRLLSSKTVLVVDETFWAWHFEKWGKPEKIRDQFDVVELLEGAKIAF